MMYYLLEVGGKVYSIAEAPNEVLRQFLVGDIYDDDGEDPAACKEQIRIELLAREKGMK